MITEVEAYTGKDDTSSHAANGKTERNKVMFGPAGHWYVYFIYGMYHCLNIVTEKDGEAGAVLIRSVMIPLKQHSHILKNVRMLQGKKITGPGRVCRALGVDTRFYGKPANKKTGLWIEDRKFSVKNLKLEIKKTSRVNVGGDTKAKKRLWRFVLA